MILTLDIGNSRIKWGVWKNAVLADSGAHDYMHETLEDVMANLWGHIERPARVILACVAGPAIEADASAWVRDHWRIDAAVFRTTKQFDGLVNAYEKPEQHGVDRWAAMIAAREMYKTPLCVISCGTAVTVDLVKAGGQHMGGQIMPGPDLMFDAIRQRLPGLSHVTERRGPDSVDVFANTTDAGLSSGIWTMLASGLDRACERAHEILGEDMQTLITGGAAHVLIPMLHFQVLHHPDLVLFGLYIAAQETRV